MNNITKKYINTFFLYFLSGILCVLPLIYSLDTQQIFSVNKFTFILFFVGISGIIFSFFSKKIKISKDTLFFSISFFATIAFSTYFSETPIISFFGSDSRHFGALFLISLFLSFIFLYQYFLESKQKTLYKSINFIFTSIAISGIISAIWAISQYIGFKPIFGGVLNFDSLSLRSFAGMGQPNFLAQFLIFPFFISCYFAIQNYLKKNKFNVILHINILFLYIVSIYTTGSRAGMLGILSGMATLIIIYFSHKLKNKYPYLLQIGVSIIIAGILSLIALIFIFGDSISLYLGDRGDSIAARFYFWNDAVELIKSHFWTGTGADMMATPLAQSLSVQALEPENFSATPDRIHSILFDIFLQYGVFGFLLFIFGIWKIVKTAILNINKNFNDTISIISLSAFISISTAWIFGFAVLTDSFIAIIFISLIFQNNKNYKNNNIPNNYTFSKLHTKIIKLTLFIFSLFLLHTAYSIDISEKALFTLKNIHTLTAKEKYNASEKILNTPYFSQNLFSVYDYLTPAQKLKAEKIGDKYNFQNNSYYQVKIHSSLAKNNKKNAKIYLQKIKENAGNLFTKRIQTAYIANTYKLISKDEYILEMQNIARNLIPNYYFNSKNNNEFKFQKFWKHHNNTASILFKYLN